MMSRSSFGCSHMADPEIDSKDSSTQYDRDWVEWIKLLGMKSGTGCTYMADTEIDSKDSSAHNDQTWAEWTKLLGMKSGTGRSMMCVILMGW